MRHFLIFWRPNHSTVDHIKAPTMLSAISKFLTEMDEHVTILPDGSVNESYGSRNTVYSHPLEYIETNYKSKSEWQIREVPEYAWQVECTNFLCGEHPAEIEELIGRCRPLLRHKLPRSRAKAFVWYLREGGLVTFYRRLGHSRIEVVARYLVTGTNDITVWTGDYTQIVESLWGPQPIMYGF